MPIAFVFALAASLGIHAAALFGTDVELFGGPDEPVPLRAELQALPPAPAVPKAAEPRLTPKPKAAPPRAVRPAPAAKPVAKPQPEPAMASVPPEAVAASPEPATAEANAEPAPAKALLPAHGTMRFVIYYGTKEFQIGRAEHNWEFSADGRYRLTGMTETVGVAALIKPIVFENESSGRLFAGGLQPEHYVTRKNGKPTNEGAEFDWSAGLVHLARNGSDQPVTPGAQDMLSLNYHLAYLKQPENGSTVGVVTGKKVDRFTLDALGEEKLELPAGTFRTLHLRTTGDTVTDIWLALDRYRLPVKIRHTDKKGDIYEQVATEIGTKD